MAINSDIELWKQCLAIFFFFFSLLVSEEKNYDAARNPLIIQNANASRIRPFAIIMQEPLENRPIYAKLRNSLMT